MLQELHAASKVLHLALDRYFTACDALVANSKSLNSLHTLQEISDSVTRELQSAASYANRISQAKSAIGVARNSYSSIVPISSLPEEIILRIFHLVLGAEQSTFETEVDEGRLPQQSLATTQVCSRWRQIALGSQRLWSRVNLSSYDRLSRQLVSRGEIFASWAGDVPLDVYLIEQLPKSRIDGVVAYQDLSQFFTSVGSRVGSLTLTFTKQHFGGYFPDILQDCLTSCAPGKLTRFVLKLRTNHASHSWLASDSESDDGGESDDFSGDAFLLPSGWNGLGDVGGRRAYRVDLTSTQLDELLFPVTVLKLDKVFPYWTSKAYYGLVELRLVSWELEGNSIRIPEQHLVGILQSSPGLRTLQFGLEIIPNTVSCPPVLLEDLGELHLQADSRSSQLTFLRLLSPGTQPLRA
ncbi:hypothetical protein FRC11_001025, partial [Ceratobasidium sp. 423]